MAEKSENSDLYLAVLPAIHLGSGLTEQILTLLPDKNLATEFFADEVGSYEEMFQSRVKYLSGGHVTGYDCFQEQSDSGRIRVRVIQRVNRSV